MLRALVVAIVIAFGATSATAEAAGADKPAVSAKKKKPTKKAAAKKKPSAKKKQASRKTSKKKVKKRTSTGAKPRTTPAKRPLP